ncbi:MAG: hypothetical protein GY775_16140 [Candidatus Scalindua sp.]|nr:hypothetical protein [Candidatus Scalindua sp.]
MSKYIKNYYFLISILILSGCYTTLTSYLPEAASKAIDIEKGKYKDIEMSLGKGFKRENLKKINPVAFLVGDNNQDFFGAGMITMFCDNLSKEFMKLGMEVVEREMLEDAISELEFQRGMFASTKNLAKIGKVIGAKGIFKGSIQAGQDFDMGIMGMGSGMRQGIMAASLKLIDIETSKVVLIITANFKKPKQANEVAKDVSKAFVLYKDSDVKTEEKLKEDP